MDDGGKHHKSASAPNLVTLARSVGAICGAIIAAGAVLAALHNFTVAGPLRQERAERVAADSSLGVLYRASTVRQEHLLELLAVMQVEPPTSARYREAQTTLRGLVRYRIGP